MTDGFAHALSRWSITERWARPALRPVSAGALDPWLGRWLDHADDLRRIRRTSGAGRFHPGEPGPLTCWTPSGERVELLVQGRHRLDLQGNALVEAQRRPPRRRLLARLATHTGLDPAEAERLLGAPEQHPCDRWTDALAPVLDAALTWVLGRAVREGASPDTLHGLQQAIALWTPRLLAAPELSTHEMPPDRLILPRHLLGRTDGPLLVDTATLSPERAQAVRDRAPPWTVLLLLGDAHMALSHLAETATTIDAVLEDPPYASCSADLAYRDTWPPGAWRALLGEHLADLKRCLPAHARGVLHIDEHRGAALETLAREHFGPDFLGMGVWDKRNPKGDALGLAAQHERLIWLCGDQQTLRAQGGLCRPKAGAQRLLSHAASLVAEHDLEDARTRYRAFVAQQSDLSAGVRAYRHLDEAGRPYRPVSMAWPNKRRPTDAYFIPLLHPVTGQPCPVPRRGWRNPPETMARLAAEGRLLFGNDHTTQPTRKYLLEEQGQEAVPSVLSWAGSDDALQAHMGLPFPYAKPLGLLRSLLDIVAPTPGSTVLDAFGGSGSTAHAVLDHPTPRRIVLAERSETVLRTTLLPRLQAALTSDVWRDGAPAGTPRDAALRIRLLDPRLASVHTH